jgi:YbgC/YbaW family acyl-CoA thioester hydrolase
MPLNTNVYTTELSVRPDDLDFFKHVHSSRYMDYVLAARYDQMKRCYGLGLEELLEHHMGFVITETKMNFKRALTLGDTMNVKTHIVSLIKQDVFVNFEILNFRTNKVSCDGYFKYSLMDIRTGKGMVIPEWVIERYSLD